MSEDEKVKDYFERDAKAFDDIYDDSGGFVRKVANKVFRKGMKERFNVTMSACGSDKKTILDIGCGAGRFCIPLAEKGMSVTGIDYSNEMIRMAEEYQKVYAEKKNKDLKIKYQCCDFVKDFPIDKKFDITITMGVFDYVKDPLPLLKKMKEVTKEKMIASFPARLTPQMPIRKLWLSTKKCPVYFYTKKSIAKFYSLAEITNYEIIDVKAGYVVIVKVE